MEYAAKVWSPISRVAFRIDSRYFHLLCIGKRYMERDALLSPVNSRILRERLKNLGRSEFALRPLATLSLSGLSFASNPISVPWHDSHGCLTQLLRTFWKQPFSLQPPFNPLAHTFPCLPCSLLHPRSLAQPQSHSVIFSFCSFSSRRPLHSFAALNASGHAGRRGNSVPWRHGT